MKRMRYVFPVLIICVHMIAISAFGQENIQKRGTKRINEESITHRNSKDGIDAYLIFHDIEGKVENEKGFALLCQVSAILKDAETGALINQANLVLKEEPSHVPKVLLPNTQKRMQTKLFISKQGMQNYVLIAQIEGLGIREFNFQHTFN